MFSIPYRDGIPRLLVSVDGTRPTPSKVEAVVRMTPPETVSQLRSFVGMMNFFALTLQRSQNGCRH